MWLDGEQIKARSQFGMRADPSKELHLHVHTLDRPTPTGCMLATYIPMCDVHLRRLCDRFKSLCIYLQ